MKLRSLLALAICLTNTSKSHAQATMEGVWRGNSLCQVKNSPCHDESVVYYSTKVVDHFSVVANKIVNGKEENMGTLDFYYDSLQTIFVCRDDARNARWEFKVIGKKISGRLIYRDQLYRIVDVKKDD